MNKEKLKRKRLSVLALRLISPGYGHCEICGLPWNHCTSKDVPIDEHRGVFATCDYCWDKVSLETLHIAYIKTYMDWTKDGIDPGFTCPQLIDAVTAEYKKNHPTD